MNQEILRDLENRTSSLNITISDVIPTLEPGEKEGMFQLKLATRGGNVLINLDSIAVQSIGVQFLEYLPTLFQNHNPAEIEENCRQSAWVVANLDNRSIQLLLRECMFHTWIDFLWYMKNERLIHRVFENCTQRCASQLMEDLDGRYRNLNPDTASPALVKKGRKAMTSILETLHRLISEGQIPDVLGLNNE